MRIENEETEAFARRSRNHHLIVTVCLLALELARAANGFGRFAHPAFGGFFVMLAHLHFTENAFALHFLFQRAQCLIDIVVAYYYFNHKNTPFRVCKDFEALDIGWLAVNVEREVAIMPAIGLKNAYP